MDVLFENKVALITGAASGIGRAAALGFAARGAIVVAVDVADASDTAAEINANGGEAVFYSCDITDEAQVEASVLAAVTKYGRIDLAFNCAGIGPDGVRWPYTELTETTAADWNKIIDVNLTGTFYCLKHELIQMRKQGGGVIVNTGSTGGDRGAPGFNAYCPSKAGVTKLTELAANENAKHNIRVNAVCPGPTFGTQMMNNTLESGEGMEETLRDRVIPMGKFGQMTDVVEAVVWLCSDMSGHTTGQSLFVDGGMHVKP